MAPSAKRKGASAFLWLFALALLVCSFSVAAAKPKKSARSLDFFEGSWSDVAWRGAKVALAVSPILGMAACCLLAGESKEEEELKRQKKQDLKSCGGGCCG
mmetsp:Transcript_26634/g.40404  ORF Transcript_26634/g.40404 Transcript_26634/m.40404 type:complete len:101 (-) Transcript_26634:101-403(-)